MKHENIRFTVAKAAMADELKQLWKVVFGDADNYIDLFFTHRFVPEQTMVALSNGAPVAMLFLLPVTIRAQAHDYKASYIYAVGTHPDYRLQGLSSRLMEAAHERLTAEGVALSLLVPAEPSLFDYYGARGYKTEFYKSEAHFEVQPTGILPELQAANLPDLITLRDRCFGKSGLFARWDSAALAYQQKEIALMGGETLHFFAPQEGYAVCYPAKEAVIIKEWAADMLYPEVLSAIAARYNRTSLVVRLAADMDKQYASKPFAMTRWYISERAAQTGKAPYLSLVLD